MSTSSIESKIQGLQARLMAENRTRDRDLSLGSSDSPIKSSPRHGRPRILGMDTPVRRGNLELPVNQFPPRRSDMTETELKLKEIMKLSGILTINGIKYQTDIKDMEHLGELGNGTCGHVVKMLHKPSGEIIAVKQMRRTGNSEENKRIVMDIDVVYKSYDCPYIVQCLGCFIMESEVWICMELMASCFDKLLKRLKGPIPEDILGKVTVATVKALSYLKEKHDLIHRDVKPSNILLSEKGNIKLCDFGISGRLVDSKAKTKSAGCAAYMAPERIDPPDPAKPDYDIRADVWSLGITLVELALGTFPYQDCKTEFEVVCRIMNETPPTLPGDRGFSDEFRSFVDCCLTKNYTKRPKYPKLLEHPFIKKYESLNIPVDQWFQKITQDTEHQTSIGTSPPSVPINSTTVTSYMATRRYTPPSPVPARRHLSLHQRTMSDTNGIPLTNGSSMANAAAPSSPPRNNTFLPAANDRIPSVSSLPPDGRTYQISRGTSSHSPYQQRSPPDRHASPHARINNSPPESSGRFSPFHQRRMVEPSLNSDRCSQSPPNFQDTGGRFSPFQQQKSNLVSDGRFSPFQKRANEPTLPPSGYPQDGRFSPFQQRRFTDISGNSYQQKKNIQGDNNYWQVPIGSPLPVRKRYPNLVPATTEHSPPNQHFNIGNTSPIVLQRFYHQQSQLQKQRTEGTEYHPHYYSYPVSQSSTSQPDNENGTKEDHGKKRFASYIKLQLGGDRRRNQSPDPPPRLSRQMGTNDTNQSPLAMRRTLLDGACPSSPSLPRRYISPSPPQPPPRRLTESNSVPGSPQHVRARFLHTPEPQRRFFRNNDLS